MTKRGRFHPANHPSITNIPGFAIGFENNGIAVNVNSLSSWAEVTGGDNLVPESTEPGLVFNRFNLSRGVELSQQCLLSSPVVLSRPWSVYFVCYLTDSGATSQILDTNAINAGVRVNASGTIQYRQSNGTRNASASGAILPNKKYIVGVFCSSSGQMSCEHFDGVNYGEESGVGGATEDFSFDAIGETAPANNMLLCSVYAFNSLLDTRHKQSIRRHLSKYLHGTYGWVGMSNSRDVVLGTVEVGGKLSWQALPSYAGASLEDWHTRINDPVDDQPWISFNGKVNEYPDTDKLIFQIPLQNSVNSLGDTQRTQFEEVLAEARRILGKGDVPCFVTPIPLYNRGANCTREQGNINASYQLRDWAVKYLTNCHYGPIFADITKERELPSSPCHVNTGFFKPDGIIARGFFGG